MNEQIEKIVSCLKEVLDPQTGKDIVSQKMVRNLHLEGNTIHFNIHIPAGNYTFKDELYASIYSLLTIQFPDLAPHVHFINQSSYSEAPNLTVPQIKNVIAVASGKGGVGKSTVSVSLAVALRDLGYKTGLMDADLYGPSMPTMLGIQSLKPQVVMIEGKPKLVPIEVEGIHTVSLGNIIEAEQAVVLRGPRLAAIIKQFFQDTEWPELDFLIIDLPPGTGDIQLTLVQTVPLTGAVIVTTPQEVSYVDALKAANMLLMDQISVPILGVIENMSWFEPDDQPAKRYYIFGSGAGERLAVKTNSTLLGQVPIKEKVRSDFDTGHAMHTPAHFKDLFNGIAKNLVNKVELRNLIFDPARIVSTN